MTVTSPILDQYGRPITYNRRQVATRSPRASYDAADENESISRHFADADGLSARAANSPEVRRRLRNRARQEFDNGGNCKGTIETIAHDTIGTGPRLQILDTESPDGFSKWLEGEYRAWADDPAIDYTDALRLAVETELRDGEIFGIFTSNPVCEHPVKVHVKLVEAEQCTSPGWGDIWPIEPTKNDGITTDNLGNPVSYDFLTAHPGDTHWSGNKITTISANGVLHWFRKSRAGQVRGVPRITAGLTLIAGIRSYSRSVLGAARIAAMMAGVMKTNMAPEEGPVTVDAYDTIPLQQDSLTALPAGWDVGQMKAEQPTTSYENYRNANLTEFGRGIHAPRNIVTGDSSPYNYSSARLDHIIYRAAIRSERNRIAVRFLDRVLKQWLREAMAIPGYMPPEYRAYLVANFNSLTWRWQYDGFESIDPVKDATATQIELETGMVTYADALAEKGKDWLDHFAQVEREYKEAERRGIAHLLYPNKGAMATTRPQPRRQSEIDTVLEDDPAQWGGYARA